MQVTQMLTAVIAGGLLFLPLPRGGIGVSRHDMVRAREGAESNRVAFHGDFAGIDRDGDMLWTTADSSAAGGLALRIQPLGSPMTAAEPVWPVRAVVSGRDSANQPYTTQLLGIIDWQKGSLVLQGEVTAGVRRGSQVLEDGSMVDFDAHGTITFIPLAALR